MDIATLVIMNVVAAALPIIGFARLLFRAQSGLNAAQAEVERRGHGRKLMADFDADYAGDIREPFQAEVRALWWDIGLVGAGLVIGAVANIWSLYL